MPAFTINNLFSAVFVAGLTFASPVAQEAQQIDKRAATCMSRANNPQWTISNFNYGQVNGQAKVNFTLINTAIDYTAKFHAISADKPNHFDGSAHYICDGVPKNDQTWFSFNTNKKKIQLSQTWNCPGAYYTATGAYSLDYQCYFKQKTPNNIWCDQISPKVTPAQISGVA